LSMDRTLLLQQCIEQTLPFLNSEDETS